MDQERERGITILAKNAAVRYGDVKLNLVDTPGHADFGGEVERGLTMVDGVMLLVDASEGPLPQTRFVLRKALEARLPVVLVRQQGRPARRPHRRGRRRGLRALPRPRRRRVADRVPDRLHQRQGRAGPRPRRASRASDLRPLLDLLVERIPAPAYDDGAPAPGARDQPRRRQLRRPARALPRAPGRDPPAASRSPGAVATAPSSRSASSELYVTEGLARVPADEAGPGEIIALAGIPEITIGETIADPDDPRAAAGDRRRRARARHDDRHQHARRWPASRAPG